jgi:hypothetical protein
MRARTERPLDVQHGHLALLVEVLPLNAEQLAAAQRTVEQNPRVIRSRGLLICPKT